MTADSNASANPPVDAEAEAIARRDSYKLRAGRLGALAIAFFVISAAAPLTGMAGGAPFAMLLGNGSGVPTSYLLVTLLMLVFAVGYVAMSLHHTSSGAFYAYIAKSMGGKAGGAAAFVALLGYNAMQIGLYGLFGVATAGFIQATFNITIAWLIIAFVAMGVIGILGYRQVDLSLKVLAVLVACEFLIVIIFDVLVLIRGGGGGGQSLNMSSFTWDAFAQGSPAIGLLFAAASFVGFEATTIYSEEAKEPRRTVPRATYIAVLTIGIFFMITTWLMVNAYGQDNLVEFIGGEELGGPTNFLFAIAEPYIGSFLTNTVMLFLFASSLFAALLAFHNAVARYGYSLGREGLVPEHLGRTHPIHLSPHIASLSQTVLAFVIVGFFAVRGLSPDGQLFTWLTQLGTLAITYLMAFAAAAVLVFFMRNKGLDSNPWRTFIAPVLGAVGLLVLAIYATSQFSFLVNLPGSPLAWILPGLIPVFALVGVIAAILLQNRQPEAYAQMGRNRLEPPVH